MDLSAVFAAATEAGRKANLAGMTVQEAMESFMAEEMFFMELELEMGGPFLVRS